jgi:hypothetical protein
MAVMNIRAAPGLSGSVYGLDTFGPLVSRRKINKFWAAYKVSGDREYDLTRFIYLTKIGQVMHHEVRGAGQIVARFGIEYSRDQRGPYVTILYLQGQWLIEYIHQLIWTLFVIAGEIVPQGVEPRCKVVGRKGWKRLVRRAGLVMDDDGMVSGWQDYFGERPWAAKAAAYPH